MLYLIDYIAYGPQFPHTFWNSPKSAKKPEMFNSYSPCHDYTGRGPSSQKKFGNPPVKSIIWTSNFHPPGRIRRKDFPTPRVQLLAY